MCNGKKLKEVNELCEININGYKDRTLWQKEGLVFYIGTICAIEDVLREHSFNPIMYDGTYQAVPKQLNIDTTENIYESEETFIL